MTDLDENYTEKINHHGIIKRFMALVRVEPRLAFAEQNTLTQFRKQVRVMRKKLGITQREMAEMLIFLRPGIPISNPGPIIEMISLSPRFVGLRHYLIVLLQCRWSHSWNYYDQ